MVEKCKAIEQIRETAMAEGEKKDLMETMSWTAQAAMDALKIPEADRAGYLAKL